jgi:hypothetical protein
VDSRCFVEIRGNAKRKLSSKNIRRIFPENLQNRFESKPRAKRRCRSLVGIVPSHQFVVIALKFIRDQDMLVPMILLRAHRRLGTDHRQTPCKPFGQKLTKMHGENGRVQSAKACSYGAGGT